jgi:hypothetical protein
MEQHPRVVRKEYTKVYKPMLLPPQQISTGRWGTEILLWDEQNSLLSDCDVTPQI